MAVKISDLAEQLGVSTKDLRAKLKDLGFPVKTLARSVEDDAAEAVKKAMVAPVVEAPKVPETAPKTPEVVDDILAPEKDHSEETAEIYGEIVAEQLEREIVKQQRKKMAGQPPVHKSAGKSDYTPQNQGPKIGIIEIPDVITVKEFSEKVGIGPVRVIGELMKNGILANINQQIDFDTAAIIATDLHVQIKRKRTDLLVEDALVGNLKAIMKQDDPEDLVTRPPIVVVMGHVDHGKTTLLDSIRSANVASSESGGITQHIAAYQVEKNGRKITFLDTPGHEAFTAMRARGAKVTDVAVLVVAADEGIMPQTIEAIHHAQEAQVPIIVAMNKIDKPHLQMDRVKGQLAEHGLNPEEWGGTTPVVPVSALTGAGIPELLEMILLVSDMQNLKANPNREAIATVIEAHLDKSLGPVATVVVNMGTLRVMDDMVVGSSYGRVKLMKDQAGKNITVAPPSFPVFIAGLSSTPESGDILQVVTGGERAAREKALQIATLRMSENTKLSGLSGILSQIHTGSLKTLKIVLKADARGSLEAIQQALAAVKHDDVAIKIIHSGVGNITESDIMMAAASQGLVVGFHVNTSPHLNKSAERVGVEIMSYTIIYKLIEDLKNLLSGLLEPEVVEVILGRATVRQIFFQKKGEIIAGCSVMSGKIENKAKLRVFRDGKKVGDGEVFMLKKFENQVKEVGEGNDCGIKYTGTIPLAVNDEVEAFKIERRKRTLG